MIQYDYLSCLVGTNSYGMEGIRVVSTRDEYAALYEEKREKIARITDLMAEMNVLSEEHSLSSEFDCEVGEWSSEKETCFRDFNKIEEEITRLELEIAE